MKNYQSSLAISATFPENAKKNLSNLRQANIHNWSLVGLQHRNYRNYDNFLFGKLIKKGQIDWKQTNSSGEAQANPMPA